MNSPLPGQVIPLPQVPDKSVFRHRAQSELEMVTWPLAPANEETGEPELLAPPQPSFIVSRKTSQDAQITFVNSSSTAARIIWINFKGEEVAYTNISAGATKVYRTFVDHVWICRNAGTGDRLLVNGSSAVVGRPDPYTVTIQELPRLPWTLDRTPLWPQQTKAEIRTLLLCFNRLWRHPELQHGQATALHGAFEGDAKAAQGPGSGSLLSILSGVLCGMHRTSLTDRNPSPEPALAPVLTLAANPAPSGPLSAKGFLSPHRPLSSGASLFSRASAGPHTKLSVTLGGTAPTPGSTPHSATLAGPSSLLAWFTPNRRTQSTKRLPLEAAPLLGLPRPASTQPPLAHDLSLASSGASFHSTASLDFELLPYLPLADGEGAGAKPAGVGGGLDDIRCSSPCLQSPEPCLGWLTQDLVLEVVERLVGTIPQNPDPSGWGRCPDLLPIRLNREPPKEEEEDLPEGQGQVVPPGSPAHPAAAQPLPPVNLDDDQE